MQQENVYNLHRDFCESLELACEKLSPLVQETSFVLPPPPQQFDGNTDLYFRLESALQLAVPEYDVLENVIKEPVTSSQFENAFTNLYTSIQIAGAHNHDLRQIFDYGVQKVCEFIQLTFYELRQASLGGYARTFRQVELETLCDCGIASVLDACEQHLGAAFFEVFAEPYIDIVCSFVVSVAALESRVSDEEAHIPDGYIVLEAPNRFERELSFATKAKTRFSRFEQQEIEAENVHRGQFFEKMNAEFEKAQICTVYCHECIFDFDYGARRSDIVRLMRAGGMGSLVEKVYMENFHSMPGLRGTTQPEMQLLRLLLAFVNELVFESDLLESLFGDVHFVQKLIQGIFEDVFNECVCEAILHMRKTLPALSLLAFVIQSLSETCKFKNGSSANFLRSLRMFVNNQLEGFVRNQLENLGSRGQLEEMFDRQAQAAKLTFFTLPSARMLYLSGIIGCLLEAVQSELQMANQLLQLCVETALTHISSCESLFRQANELNLLLAMCEFVKIPNESVDNATEQLKSALQKCSKRIQAELCLKDVNPELTAQYEQILAAHGLIGTVEADQIINLWREQS